MADLHATQECKQIEYISCVNFLEIFYFLLLKRKRWVGEGKKKENRERGGFFVCFFY